MDNLEFETLTAEEFDAYLKHHKEKEYLMGGLLARSGKTLPGYPKVQIF
jgi:hypothetical protein